MIPAAGPDDEFGAGIASAMKRVGIRGRPVRVRIEGDALHMEGAKSGEWNLPLAAVERVRIGFYESKYGKIYRTGLWLQGKEEILLQPMKPYRGYSSVVRQLASEVAARRGLACVERGTGLSLALFNFLVLAGGAAALVLVFLLDWDPSLWPLLLLLIAFVGLALYACREMRGKHLPRPVTSLDELDVQLP
ncbi:MAG TPA: hypothetical protein VGB59_12555 [Allosphingosinicella sp.]|jgi:hypothetical protein